MKQNIIPTGNLDLENDPLAVKDGDYTDALDVTAISQSGNTVSWEPVLGNVHSFKLPNVNAGPKTIRMFFDHITLGDVYTLNFTRPNRIPIANMSFTTLGDLELTKAAAVTAIMSMSYDPLSVPVISNVVGDIFIDITLGTIPWDWFVSSDLSSAYEVRFETIVEAVDTSMADYFTLIGGDDLLGDLFCMSTTGNNMPETAKIINVIASGAGEIEIVLDKIDWSPLNSLISVVGIQNDASSQADGEWIVVPGAFNNSLILLGTIFDGFATYLQGVATKFIKTMSAIGVATHDPVTQITTYTNLIISSKFNFRSKKRIQLHVESDSIRKSLYWCDGYNLDRCMYYYGEYIDNGFLNNDIIAGNVGAYNYDDIFLDTSLSVSPSGASLNYISTVHGGGSLYSGNYRYSVRLVTESNNATEWSELGQIINIYSSAFSNYAVGNTDTDTTTKLNNLRISNIDTESFKFLEIAFVRYVNNGKEAYILPRFVISSETMDVTHRGSELYSSIDAGELINGKDIYYFASHSIDVLDNRMIRSNVEADLIANVSLFFKTWRHSIKKKPVASIGLSTSGPFNNYYGGGPTEGGGYAEYFNTINTHRYKTFVHLETYRLAARVKFKNQSYLPVDFWIDDICIDVLPINNGNIFGDNRRDSGLPDYDLNTGTGTSNESVNVTYIEFSGINWDYLIDGKRASDLIEEVSIHMVEMSPDKREVLTTGAGQLYYSFIHNTGIGGTILFNSYFPGVWTGFSQLTSGSYDVDQVLHEWNFYGGVPEWFNIVGLLPGRYGYYDVANSTGGSGPVPDIDKGIAYCAMYAQDEIYNDISITPIPGDIIYWRQFTKNSNGPFENIVTGGGAAAMHGMYDELVFGAGAGISVFNENIITEGARIGDGSSFTFSNGDIIKKYSAYRLEYDTGYADAVFHAPESAVVQSGWGTGGFLDVQEGNVTPDNQLYCIYYRDKGKGAKFAPDASCKYIPTGTIFKVNERVSSIDVFGDAFVQASWIKTKSPVPSSAVSPPSPWPIFGGGYGFLYYSQNRVNSQMRSSNNAPATDIPPSFSVSQWLASAIINNSSYTNGYSNRNEINVYPAFDDTIRDTNIYPTRIIYSDVKPNGSNYDGYRKYLPLNFIDLDQRNGEIVHHAVGNGELLTWQQRSFQRQYFNSNGVLTTRDGSEVIIGDNGALRRRGLQISSIGSKHKWSIIKGVSKGGNDVFAWINTEYGFVIRFGYDGTVPVSDVHNIRNWVDKHVNIADVRMTPCHNEGIHGVWNSQRRSYIWAIRAWRHFFTAESPITLEEFTSDGFWDSRVRYKSGYVLYFELDTQLPRVFKLILPAGVDYSINEEPTLSSVWEEVTDPSFYNVQTIEFNELRNGFSTRFSFTPKIMLRWGKKFVSPHPQSVEHIYRHEEGERAAWYSRGLVSDPYITMICNKPPDIKKDFIALEMNSQDLPARIELTTNQHVSYLNPSDMEKSELHENAWAAQIMNDSTISPDNPTGVNNADTSSLFGQYLLIKFVFAQRTYNKIFQLIVKYLAKTRDNNS